MKSTFFYFFILFGFLSCEKKPQTITDTEIKISERLFFSHKKEGINIQSGTMRHFIDNKRLPLENIILLNSSLIGYFEMLDALDQVKGVTSPQYIYSPSVHERIQKGTIQVIGNEQKIDIEKILSLQPDAVFSNYIATQENVYSVLKNNGIEVIFIDEYLEQNPLEKSAYIQLFGALLGKKELAIKQYNAIEKKYNTLREKVKKSQNAPLVMTNEMYGNIWYMPGGNSFLAKIISDAGGNYLLKDNSEVGSVSMSFEQVILDAKNAHVWVNAGAYSSKKELLAVHPQYQLIPVVKSGKVYSLMKAQKGSANNFFEQGNVRADLVLRDYITAFHPHIFPKDSLTFLQELE